jgi:hypothetical protein
MRIESFLLPHWMLESSFEMYSFETLGLLRL